MVGSTSPGVAGLDDPPQAPEATEDAVRAVGLGVWASGVRCVLVYVVAPLAGGLGGLLGVVGLLLQVAATLTCCAGARTLWRTRHPARLPYAVIAVLVLAGTLAAFARL